MKTVQVNFTLGGPAVSTGLRPGKYRAHAYYALDASPDALDTSPVVAGANCGPFPILMTLPTDSDGPKSFQSFSGGTPAEFFTTEPELTVSSFIASPGYIGSAAGSITLIFEELP